MRQTDYLALVRRDREERQEMADAWERVWDAASEDEDIWTTAMRAASSVREVKEYYGR